LLNRKTNSEMTYLKIKLRVE